MHEQTEKEDLTMKKRVLAALLCTSLTAGALAGCGSFGGKETAAGTKAPETAGTEGSAGTETAADKEPVELTLLVAVYGKTVP